MENSPPQPESVPVVNLLRSSSLERRQERSSSPDEMSFNLKESVLMVLSPSKSKQQSQNFLDNISSTEVSVYCKAHTEEEAQFYSFTHDRALCSECLLTGKYIGCEVISLKKAADKIKIKFEDLLLEIVKKNEQLSEWEDKLGIRKLEISEFVLNYKKEVREKFDELRAAIEKREQEILDNIDSIKNEKLAEIEEKFTSVQKCHEEISSLKETVQNKFLTMKEADICQYYSNKSASIRHYINESFTTKGLNQQFLGQVDNIRSSYSLREYVEGVQQLVLDVQNLKGLELDAPTPELKLFQVRFNQTSSTLNEDFSLEHTASPGLDKRTVNLNDEPSQGEDSEKRFEVEEYEKQSHNSTRALEIEGIGKSFSEEKSNDDGLRRLLERIDSTKKSMSVISNSIENPWKGLKNHSVSKLGATDSQNQSFSRLGSGSESPTKLGYKISKIEDLQTEKDSGVKKYWETYKELLDSQHHVRRSSLSNSTTKPAGETEKAKVKTFVYDFNKARPSIGSESPGLGLKKEASASNLSNGNTNSSFTSALGTFCSSAKSLRVQDDLLKRGNAAEKSASKLNYYKRRQESFSGFPSSSANKSFESAGLTTNVRNLQSHIRLWGEK